MNDGKRLVAKQSSKNSVNLVIGFLVGALANIIILPYLFNDSPEYLGTIQVVISLTYILGDAVMLGAPTMIVRYFNELFRKSNASLLKVLSLPALLLLCGYISFITLFLVYPEFLQFLSKKSELDTTSTFSLAIILGVIIVASNKILGGVLNALGNTSEVSFANELLFRVLILVWSIYYYFSGKSHFESFSIIIVFLFLTVTLFVQLKKSFVHYVPLAENNNTSRLEMMKFSLFSGARSLTNTLQQRLDVIIISYFLGNTDVVIFNIGVYFAAVTTIPSRSIEPMAATVVSQSWATGDMPRIQRVYSASAINQLLLAGVILIGIIGVIPILRTVLPSSFQGFELTLIILGLAKLVSVGFGINTAIISTSPSYQLSFLFHVSLVILLVFSMIWMIPIYGKEGAALASFITFLIFNTFKVVFLKKKYGFALFKGTFITCSFFIYGTILLSIVLVLSVDSMLINALFSFLSTTILILIAIKMEWSEDLNKMIFGLKEQLLNRF